MERALPQSRTLYVTGVGAGIGAATARLFVSQGWTVGGCDVRPEGLEALRAEFGGTRFEADVVDVRDRAALGQSIARFAQRHGGRLDVVFANAGVLYMGPDALLTAEQKQRLIDVNVSGVVHTLDAARPWLLAAAPHSRAIAMCSASAEYGAPQHAVYGATKFFVRGLTEALDLEWQRDGVRVSGIYVSYVATGMVSDANARPPSVDTLGVKATAAQVARTVWRAAHGSRVHWRVGFDARMTHYAARLLGPWIAPVYARLMGR